MIYRYHPISFIIQMTNCKTNYTGNGNNMETHFKKKRIVLKYYPCQIQLVSGHKKQRTFVHGKMAKTKRQFDKKLVSGRYTIICRRNTWTNLARKKNGTKTRVNIVM